jgi:hypothetical protein
MSTARRITPAEVLAAKERHPEVLLTRGLWARPVAYSERRAGIDFIACPLGLVSLDAGTDRLSIYLGGMCRVAEALGLDLDYIDAFARSVDGTIDDADADTDRMRQGIEDGRAVAAAVFGEATP